MSEEKKKRNKIVGISIGILVVLLVVISSTYAYWQITKSQNGSNDIIAACLDIDMQSVDGTFGLNPAWPISDNEGMQLDGYTFKVTNRCETEVNYVIGIDSLEVSGASYLDYNNIKISVDNTPSIIYGSQEDIKHIEENDSYQIRDSKKLYTATVKGKEGEELGVNTHNVKVWINSESSVEEQSKVFSGRMFITGGQKIVNDKPMAKLIATGDISKTENDNVLYSLYDDGTLNIYGTGDIKDYEEYTPIYFELLNNYVVQNNIELTSDEINSINNVSMVPMIVAVFSESDEYIEHITNGQIKTYNDGINNISMMVGEENGKILLSLKNKMSDFPNIFNINIYDGVTSTGEYTFYNTFINNINMPATLKNINSNSFNSSYIYNISIKEGLENIGTASFLRAVIKNKIEFPDTLKEFGWAPFENVIINSLELSNNNIYTLNGAYFSKAQISELIIPENVLNIGFNFSGVDFTNTTIKLYGPERTIEGLDLTQFKEVIWNYQGE